MIARGTTTIIWSCPFHATAFILCAIHGHTATKVFYNGNKTILNLHSLDDIVNSTASFITKYL